MQVQALVFSLLVSFVAAQGSVCFDAGDCILAGGQCVKPSGAITGTCSGNAATTLSTVTTGGAPAATGSTCYDDGDCIFSGGHCVKDPNSIFGLLGTCQK